MKFSRLRLHGFKSFSDATELVFEPGLTGVIGPNGCGKSNLVEALRWVMGESSYKAMRGAGMDDVIFSGSANRPSRNSAEVTLVLDNSDRTAPAALNIADVLEVTRRIVREEGSVYRVNGREVRARDVQLLFADASTGSHSPALVRQGQIGELIAAKPTQRRALLEEAAGISGLHSRRHEAEIRLRAAEQNLERVDDIIAQIAQQLEQLRRQARLAIRYRALSGDIRKAEAALYHVRWVATRFAEKENEAEQSKAINVLADSRHAEREATRRLERADLALAPLRQTEAGSGAALQRLRIHSEQLSEEIRQAETRRTEYEARLKQLTTDALREQQLADESAETLRSYCNERARLTEEEQGESAALARTRAELDTAADTVAKAEVAARDAGDELARRRARRAEALRGAADAAVRIGRIEQQVQDVERDATKIAAAIDADATIIAIRARLHSAQVAAATAECETMVAEAASRAAQAAVDAARPRLQATEAALTRREVEAATLSKLGAARTGRWGAIADKLTVAPGYETALGAALGDDLEASADVDAPLRWAATLNGTEDPLLPDGAEPLSQFVTGSLLLQRRLDQVGIIAGDAGPEMLQALHPGQRLVTLNGDLWRWDGFVAAADAPSAAAQRLAQRNRLTELSRETAEIRAERDRRRAEIDGLLAALTLARETERLRREARRQSQHVIAAAQCDVDLAQKSVGDLAIRRSALDEARARLTATLNDTIASRVEAERMLDEMGGDTAETELATARLAALARAREHSDRVRLQHGSFETAARMRQARLGQIEVETGNWQRRGDSARAQLATLNQRSAEIAGQLAAMTISPAGFVARLMALETEIDIAKTAHQAAVDSLDVAETGYRTADKALRLASNVLSGAREALARVEERLKGSIAQRQLIERQISEVLGIEARGTAQAAGIRPEEALPSEGPLELKVDRLKAERERLGGVNLTAEREAEDSRDKHDVMVKDRDDLIEAIAKLRSGIQSLNREGRNRLSEAFEKVNGHFQQLFTELFGGGTAELQFVENDDPLEAGLEIIARPPGKKPTTMTLLSGGEQALTAMALIFAVFLTNPAPICVLDEVDAPLDDANVERFCTLLDSMRQRTDTRFVVITHNPITMSRVDRLFGVTMAERGVSQLVSVDLTGSESVRAAS